MSTPGAANSGHSRRPTSAKSATVAALSIAVVADRLGVPERTLRRWVAADAPSGVLARPGIPELHILRAGSTWRIVWPEEAASSATRPATPANESAAIGVESANTATMAALSAELTALRSELTFLRRQVEQDAVERAELRRLAAAAQQQLSDVLQRLPLALAEPGQDAATRPESAYSASEVAEVVPPPAAADTLAQALRDAGVKKKQRRKLLDRLAAVWRG